MLIGSVFARSFLNPDEWLKQTDALIGAGATFEYKLNKAWRNIYVLSFAQRMVDRALPVYLMLAALAAKNLLKAFVVRARREEFERHILATYKDPTSIMHAWPDNAGAHGSRNWY